MVKTIQAALSPLLTVGSICGLSIFEYPLGRSRPYLSCLYLSVTWSLYALMFYYLFCKKYTIVMSWPLAIVMLATAMSMFDSLFRSKELSVCLRKLSIVDDTLEILGTPKEYRSLRKWTIKVIIGWMVLACFLNMLDCFWIYNKYFDILRSSIPFFGNHLIHVNTYSGLIWCIILGYTGSRFQRLNELIHKLLNDDTDGIERWNKLILVGQQRSEIRDCKRYMWIIMHVHLHLCHISHRLNKVFSMQMTLQMASYFAFFVELLSVVYTSYIDKNKTIENVLDGIFSFTWLVVCLVKLFGLNHICQTVSDKARETVIILHKLSNDNPDGDLRDQAVQFILQIKQREVKFSGMGLFYFGYSFIGQFCKSVVTVLIIIIQMHLSYHDLIRSVDNEDYVSI